MPTKTPTGRSAPSAPTRRDSATRDQLIKRLRRFEGQVRGIEGMVEGDRYCIDELTQISAVRAAVTGWPWGCSTSMRVAA